MATFTRSDEDFAPSDVTPFGSYASWESVLAAWSVVDGPTDFGVSPSSTLFVLTNSDGTFTVLTGTGFTHDGNGNPTGGTIATIQRVASDGGTVCEQIEDFTDPSLVNFKTNLAQGVGHMLSGNDDINGGTSSVNILYGYDGEDTFVPVFMQGDANTGLSYAELVGGRGADTFTIGDTDVTSTIIVAYILERLFNGGTQGVTVNLQAGTATDTFGDHDTLQDIHFVVATDLKDNLTGSNGNDIFAPGGGNDKINGGRGFDTLSYAYVDQLKSDGFGYTSGITVTMSAKLANAGTVRDPNGGTDAFTGIELVIGTQFNDTFKGGTFADTFAGMGGEDNIKGGGGIDTVDYSQDYLAGGASGVVVDLLNHTATDSFGDTDTLSSIEKVIGTYLSDVFIGGNGNDFFIGNGSGGGSDSYTGNGGIDTVSYANEGSVHIDFVEGSMNDSFDSIESFMLSSFDDFFVGNSATGEVQTVRGGAGGDVISAGAGNDKLFGDNGDDWLSGGAGKDLLNGGAGNDTAVYQDSAVGVTISLASTKPQKGGGDGKGDTLISIENLVGSLDASDHLTGNAGANDISGGGGGDFLAGGKGHDSLHGEAGADTFIFREAGAANADDIWDYNNADENDVIDLSALIDKAFKASSNPSDFVHRTIDDDNNDVHIQVDVNGAKGGAHFVDVAVLKGYHFAPDKTITLHFEHQNWTINVDDGTFLV